MERPQITILVIISLNIIGNAILHGQPRKGEYSVLAELIVQALFIFILTKGGFFTR